MVPLGELTTSLGDAIPSNLDCSECVVRIPESMKALYQLEYITPVYHAESQNESLSEPDFLTFYDNFQKQIAFYFPDETFDESLVHVSSYDYDKGFVGLNAKGEPDSGYPTLQSTYDKIADGTWFAMFAPILSAFPFVPAIINNRITQSARFTISRIGKRRYQLGNICTTFLSGGMAVVLGYALFGIAVWLLRLCPFCKRCASCPYQKLYVENKHKEHIDLHSF